MKLPLTFVISQTFECWSEDDIEAGETNNRGFDFEKENYDLEDLKNYIERNGFNQASESPVISDHVWLSNHDEPFSGPVVSQRNSLHCNYIMDADGLPIDTAMEGKLWRNIVRQAVGEKNLESSEDLSI